jgi:hypothetical protein
MPVVQLVVKKLKDAEMAKATEDNESVASRLLSLNEAGRYLGISYWTIRDLVLSGVIPQVNLPCSFVQVRKAGKVYRAGAPAGATIKRILVDRRDLDGLIERSKGYGTE